MSRADRRPQVEIWPIQLADALPNVGVPLDPGDADATFDLQEVLSTLHDEMGYHLSVGTTKPPPGLLGDDEAAWLDERLGAAGRR